MTVVFYEVLPAIANFHASSLAQLHRKSIEHGFVDFGITVLDHEILDVKIFVVVIPFHRRIEIKNREKVAVNVVLVDVLENQIKIHHATTRFAVRSQHQNDFGIVETVPNECVAIFM